jgi:hypothetical protein
MSKDDIEINFNKDWWIKNDMTTFSGRIMHWINVSDFRKSFHTGAQLKGF